MIKKDVLLKNEVLKSLTDEQIAVIEQLSANDENDVIARKTSEIYKGLDNDIKALFNKDRNSAEEKTYDYLKRVCAEFIASNDSKALNDTIEQLKKEKADLLANGDTESKRLLEQVNSELASAKSEYNKLKRLSDEKDAAHAKALTDIRIDSELKNALSGLKFKADVQESMLKLAKQAAIDAVKASNPTYINANGSEMLVFKDANGGNILNPNNGLNPYTASEFLASKLKEYDVLDEGRKAGGGTVTVQTSGGTLDLAGIKTKTEAIEAISKSLLADGLTRGSEAYYNKLNQAMEDNKVNELPD